MCLFIQQIFSGNGWLKHTFCPISLWDWDIFNKIVKSCHSSALTLPIVISLSLSFFHGQQGLNVSPYLLSFPSTSLWSKYADLWVQKTPIRFLPVSGPLYSCTIFIIQVWAQVSYAQKGFPDHPNTHPEHRATLSHSTLCFLYGIYQYLEFSYLFCSVSPHPPSGM